ncbi:MAG TPA: dienelactone hydrolase family protein [Ktedonobacterales bacterium]|nr:dienelactone hydrolase family protein [Ktedonobacterales bacterium]
MTGRMIDFDANGSTAPGYLAAPDAAAGPEVVVLHEWWGLTEPIRQACDRLAEAGFVALAPDLYRGKTTAKVEEADALGSALDQQVEQWRGDIRGAVQYLRQNGATSPADGRGAIGFVAFSLGGSYALDMSIHLADEIAAVVTYYANYPGLDYSRAKAAYLCHFAEDDPYVSAAAAAEMEQQLQAAGRLVTVYTYPGTTHWFFDADRPEAYNATAAALAWERTVAFLNAELRR